MRSIHCFSITLLILRKRGTNSNSIIVITVAIKLVIIISEDTLKGESSIDPIGSAGRKDSGDPRPACKKEPSENTVCKVKSRKKYI